MMSSTCNPLMKTPTFKNLKIATKKPVQVKTIEVVPINRARDSAKFIWASDGVAAVVAIISFVDGAIEVVSRILPVAVPPVPASMKSGLLNLLGPKKNLSGDRS